MFITFHQRWNGIYNEGLPTPKPFEALYIVASFWPEPMQYLLQTYATPNAIWYVCIGAETILQ